MALSASSIFEVESGGSDTANGGIFDPSKVSGGGFTDGAATSANTSAPVFTSASYNFVAGDQDAWLYIDSGTNWTPGWYKITSVASNAATLSAAVGAGVLAGSDSMTTVIGCATTASPTGAKWSIDYSQQTGAEITYTDMATTGTGLAVTSSAHPFAKQLVGNSIVVTSGTNFNAGRYVIASISGTTATVVGPTNISTGVGASGAGGLGGAFATPGKADGLMTVAGQVCAIKQISTYSITSTSNGVASGCLGSSAVGTEFFGYTSNRYRFNRDTRPTLQSNVASATQVAAATSVAFRNLIFDGNSQTTAKLSSGGSFFYCRVQGFNTASTSVSTFIECYATSNSAAVFTGNCVFCICTANTSTPMIAGAAQVHAFNLSYANTGGTTDGASTALNGAVFINNVYHGNGANGVTLTGSFGMVENCIAYSNAGIGLNGNAAASLSSFKNCAVGANGTPTSFGHYTGLITLNGDPFTNAAGGDFSLNTTAGAGALVRAAGFPGVLVDGLSTGYLDVGAVQHADPASTGYSGGIFGG